MTTKRNFENQIPCRLPIVFVIALIIFPLFGCEMPKERKRASINYAANSQLRIIEKKLWINVQDGSGTFSIINDSKEALLVDISCLESNKFNAVPNDFELKSGGTTAIKFHGIFDSANLIIYTNSESLIHLDVKIDFSARGS